MIVPSIDLMNGRAVQLRRGREFVLDGGDPLARLEEFAIAGEVAVVDLDAALGQGSNADLIRRMARRARIRVGGGIRSAEVARDWLDAGAARVMIGTAASPELCGRLPRDRVVVAVDTEGGAVVVDGWRARTGADPLTRIRELAPVAAGFLLTQVEVEGGMAGFDRALVEAAAAAARAGGARVTAAGGITSAGEIAWLDALGVDAQVGMALYAGRLDLGEAVAAPLRRAPSGDLWPTVVADETGAALGLVWSTRASVAAAVRERAGIYWSRSRNALWRKGGTSGATQRLLRVELDCDRDALRFTVRQSPPGFCHTGARSCWGDRLTLGALEAVIAERLAGGDPSSSTARLARDGELLRAKLREEAEELAAAGGAEEAVAEAADLLYFTLAALVRAGGSLSELFEELDRRRLRVRRRPMTPKPARGGP